MFALLSSISKSKEKKEERKSTAISFSGTPSSLRSRILSTINLDCKFSVEAATMKGKSPPDFLV